MPDIANDLPGLHLLTGSYTDGRTVCIQSFQPSAVIDLDVIAVAAAPANATLIPAATAVTRLCSLARK